MPLIFPCMLCLLAVACLAAAESVVPADWQLLHRDPLTGDWREQWSLDGHSKVETGSNGMVFTADKGQNDVLWFKPRIEGDVAITYTFEHLVDSPNVIILFVQATGSGEEPYVEDLFAWQDLRESGRYPLYKQNMNYVSVSYANGQDEVRFRQCLGFDVIGKHDAEGAFAVGKVYDVCFTRIGREVVFTATDQATGTEYRWPATMNPEPLSDSGWIGIRHMNRQSARYRDFAVYRIGQ